jgi:hypothetical protein
LKESVMVRLLIGLLFLLLASSLVLAETPPPATATLSPRQQIDQDATRILAGYTATAEAIPISPEQTDSFIATAFGLALCSMLLVLIPLMFGVWRMSRKRP